VTSALECRDLYTSFGGNHVHRGISIAMRGGEITGLIGPNGCGKSTLLNVITGAVRPDSGQILLDGRDLTGMPSWRRYRAGLTRSFQNLELFEQLTVRDNLKVALGGDKKRIAAALEQAKLSDAADRRPSELAFGQRKALSLARLYGRSASAVLLDEPAAGLSPEEVEPVLSIARALAADGAVVCLVEHNMQIMAGYAAVVYLMAEGTIIASGPPAELMSDAKLAEIFFGTTGTGALWRSSWNPCEPGTGHEPCCSTSTSRSSQVRSSGYSATTAPARRHCCACCPGRCDLAPGRSRPLVTWLSGSCHRKRWSSSTSPCTRTS
jgi:branched-chain amino acid transport system ATP-binding protein